MQTNVPSNLQANKQVRPVPDKNDAKYLEAMIYNLSNKDNYL